MFDVLQPEKKNDIHGFLIVAGSTNSLKTELALGLIHIYLEALMRKWDLCHIYLVAPTTPDERIALIVKRGKGFIYYVSREGVTGMQSKMADTIITMTAKIRTHTDLPVAVGFGISTPEQAKMVAKSAEAVVIGSAIVNQIAERGGKADLIPHVTQFVGSLITAVKNS